MAFRIDPRARDRAVQEGVGARKLVRNLVAALKRGTPVDTGAARAAWHVASAPRWRGAKLTASIVNRVKHLRYQVYGTGPWIYPRSHRFLRFKPKRGGGGAGRDGYVYAKRVKGVEPNDFMLEAMRDVAGADWRITYKPPQ